MNLRWFSAIIGDGRLGHANVVVDRRIETDGKEILSPRNR